ncbi:MAG: uroporphyrinogen-III synthase [Thermoplasmatales archaeon]|nr:MAG: uroporphyrinogen-III synthase [Thermoplasmatales archaeon]
MVIISFRPEEKFKDVEIRGNDVLNIPLVRILKLDNVKSLDLEMFDGIAFTSSTGVRYFFSIYSEIDEKMMIFSIGDSTARELMKYVNNPLVCSDSYSGGFASFIADYKPKRVLIPRGMTHSSVLNEDLRKAGIYSENFYLYKYENIDQRDNIARAVKNKQIALIFTSPLEVKLFNQYTGGRYLDNPAYPIGKTTFSTLKEAGFVNIRFDGKKSFSELIDFINSQ